VFRAVHRLAADDRREDFVTVIPDRKICALAGCNRAAIAFDAEQ
jgi:hypothetical protein